MWVKYVFFLFQSEKDYDPFADRRRPTIADREDEYRQKRRRLIISPERVDPFADGEYFCIRYVSYIYKFDDMLFIIWKIIR